MHRHNFLCLMVRLLLWTLFATLSQYAAVTAACDSDVCLTLIGNELRFESSKDIYGYQFDHTGCVDSIANGQTQLEESSITNRRVIVYFVTGQKITERNGILTELTGSGLNFQCLSNFIFAGEDGLALTSELSAEYELLLELADCASTQEQRATTLATLNSLITNCD